MFRNIHLGDGSFIASYNLLIGTGIAMAMLYLQYERDFRQKTENDKFRIHLSIIISVIMGFTGAFAFDAWSQGIPLRLENLNRIGLTFFSGLVVGMALLAGFLKVFSFPVLKTFNQLTPAFCIAHIFGRIGCFLAGCCFGRPTATVFGVKFPKGSLPYQHYNGDVSLHPTQLYESFFVLAVFMLFHFKRPKNAFIIYIGSYSLFRFAIEFLRADDRGVILGQDIFTPSQMISICVFILAAMILAFQKHGTARLRI